MNDVFSKCGETLKIQGAARTLDLKVTSLLI